MILRRRLPPIPPRASKAPKRLETDLKTLADAANEAAKREAAQWFYFVTIMLTLAAIVGSTTHRVLFLEDPVKVPLLQVALPLQGFYVVAPAIFVVLHFYLLAQIRLMAEKVRQFLDAVQAQARRDVVARDLALSRLDTFPRRSWWRRIAWGGRAPRCARWSGSLSSWRQWPGCCSSSCASCPSIVRRSPGGTGRFWRSTLP